jgi:Taurine catabolism dioxygenase TauD, TfdA family
MLDASKLRSETFEIRPSDTMVGAEVLRLDLSKPLDEAAYEKVSAALDSFSVVCFRDQDLTPEQHIAFSCRFGPLQVNVRSEFNKPGYPEIYIVSNMLVDGKPIGSQDAGRYWHSDLCYLQRPSRASLLYALLQKKWPEMKILTFPAFAERDERWRKKGEPLFPELKPLKQLLDQKRVMSESSWAAEFQGRPFLTGSGAIPIEKLKILPYFSRDDIASTVMSVDKAGTAGGDGAYTAYTAVM